MTIKVKTESGSIYEFIHKDGRVFFQKGKMLTGEVVRISNGIIHVGKPIEMDYIRYGLYGKPDDECVTFISTTPVTEIFVKF